MKTATEMREAFINTLRSQSAKERQKASSGGNRITEFKLLQDVALMENYEVAEYFEVTQRTVCRWRSGESEPSAVVMRMMGNLATSRVNKEVFGGDYE